MVKSIGFRVEPKAIHYAVVKGTKQKPELLSYDTLSAPKSYTQMDEKLLWYRNSLLTILNNDYPDFGVIRIPESIARVNRDSLKRAWIEGLIFSLLAERGIDCTAGAFNTISSQINSKSAKQYLSNDNFRTLDWSDIKNHKKREAIITAVTKLEE